MSARNHQRVYRFRFAQHVLEGQSGRDRQARACLNGASLRTDDGNVVGKGAVFCEIGRRRKYLEGANHVEVMRAGIRNHEDAPRPRGCHMMLVTCHGPTLAALER